MRMRSVLQRKRQVLQTPRKRTATLQEGRRSHSASRSPFRRRMAVTAAHICPLWLRGRSVVLRRAEGMLALRTLPLPSWPGARRRQIGATRRTIQSLEAGGIPPGARRKAAVTERRAGAGLRWVGRDRTIRRSTAVACWATAARWEVAYTELLASGRS